MAPYLGSVILLLFYEINVNLLIGKFNTTVAALQLRCIYVLLGVGVGTDNEADLV